LKRTLFIGVIALLAAGALYLTFGRNSKEEPEIKYITVPVEKGTLKAQINSTGTLKPLVEVLVGSQVSGTIKALYADFESVVKKGQLIALIDPDTFEAKAAQAKADVEAARAGLVKSEVTLADDLLTLRRKEGLVGKGSISQSDYDTAKAKADASAAQVGVEKAKLLQMEAKREEADLQVKYARIITPVDGVVTARNMDVGQTVTASFQTPVLFKIAEDLTRMQVHTNVDEADIGRVKVGQKSLFTVPAFPEEVFTASVTQIRNDPKVEQNVVTYNVVMDVNNAELKLRPGMTATVQILLSEVTDALMVPDQAFRFTPPQGALPKGGVAPIKPGYRRVWKVEKGNIKPVDVRAGIVGTERTQIFSDELKAGDTVAVEAVASKEKGRPGGSGIRFRF
jgi:HlyD family secretion protein